MIPIISIILNRAGSWIFTWSDDGQAFSRVVLYGIELLRTTGLTYTFDGQDYFDAPPPLEIAYEDEQVWTEQFLPFMEIQWYTDGAAVDTYQVQESTDGGTTWSAINVQQELGSWIYTFQTDIQLDEQTYRYRVIAKDSIGNESTPRYYTRYVVTPPQPPIVVIGYLNPMLIVAAS